MRKTDKKDLDAIVWLAQIRWPKEIECPFCQSRDVSDLIKTRGIWQCRSCREQFGVFHKTIFEGIRIKPSLLPKYLDLYFQNYPKRYSIRKFMSDSGLKTYSTAQRLFKKISTRLEKSDRYYLEQYNELLKLRSLYEVNSSDYEEITLYINEAKKPISNKTFEEKIKVLFENT